MTANNRPTRIHREVIAALKASGLPWTMTICNKHDQFYLCGELIGTVSRSNGSHNSKKIIASINRVMRNESR